MGLGELQMPKSRFYKWDLLMRGLKLIGIWLLLSGSLYAQVADEKFVVVVYNVENLFDADEVALYDDYKPDRYRPTDMAKKIKNITQVLAHFRGGKGPNIILFQEFEADQTPGSQPVDYVGLLKKYSSTTVDAMLSGEVSRDVRDLPVEVLLLKSLQEAGLDRYEIAMGEYRPDPTGRTVAHVNATFSQFPIVKSTTHQTAGARGILEVVHQVHGNPLFTLNNHWKSGASNLEDETVRLGNARTLRARLDQILQQDPSADVIIGGDFNSQYNQKNMNPTMKQTAINDIAGSQGDELALLRTGGPSLYNLWFELAVDRRGSDVYQGNWGTLMQIMLTRGLYDYKGVQYVDNSFGVAALENLNAQPGTKVPFAWQSIDGLSGGFSDHLPIYAQFQVVKDNASSKYLQLQNPGTSNAPNVARAVDYAAAANAQSFEDVKSLGSDKKLRTLDNIGHIFKVDSKVSADFPFRVMIFEEEYTVWSHNEKFRVNMYQRFPVGSTMKFLGELGIHKGKWQFVVRDPSWLEVDSAK
jgi:Endonuclease/Exonuclease/phosphatase family